MIRILITDHPDALTTVKASDGVPDPEELEFSEEMAAAVELLSRCDDQRLEHFRRFELPRLFPHLVGFAARCPVPSAS